MVLNILEILGTKYFPTQYTVQIAIGIATAFALRAYSQGRATDRERDLHARTILLTGGFTPFGLTILQELAQRGAHIIALSPDPIDSPRISLIVDALRSATANEQIYAEQCDLLSPASIQSFCKRFLSGEEKRLDAILLTHEYAHIGAFKRLRTRSTERDNAEREQLSLASFLLTTLLLPSLLTAPTERDIRIINVVNRFYAAAASSSNLYSSLTSAPPNSLFIAEGTRSLRTIILTRHLQRILDALPSAHIPSTDSSTSAVPVVSPDSQKSNIVAVSVSPGISRADTVARMLSADWTDEEGYSKMGVLLYLFILPILHLFSKSSVAAVQSVLHVLFLPTPFKVLSRSTERSSSDKSKAKTGADLPDAPEEVLKPGAVYAECAVVGLKVPSPPPSPSEEDEKMTKPKVGGNESGKVEGKGKEKGKAAADLETAVESMELPDDGEIGGEPAGRRVWEAFEAALKAWEKANPSLEELEAEARVKAEEEGEAARAK